MSDSETEQPFSDHREFRPTTIKFKTHLDLPAPNRARAPTTFDGTPGTLEPFLETYEYLCQRYEIISSKEKYQGLIRYCSAAVAKLLRGLPSHRKRSYLTLLEEVKYFFGDRSECLNLAKLERFTRRARQKKMKTIRQFQRYQLRFHQMVGPALEKKKISTKDANRYFWEGLDENFRARVEARMLATNPELDVSVPFSIDDIRQGADYILNPNRFDQHLAVKDNYESSDSESDVEHFLKRTKCSGYSSEDESEDDTKPLIQRKYPLTPPKTPPRGKKSKGKEEKDLDKLVERMRKLQVSEPAYWVEYAHFVQEYPQLQNLIEPPTLRNSTKTNPNSRPPFQRDIPPHQAPNYRPRPQFNTFPRQPTNPPFQPAQNQPSQQTQKLPQPSFATGPNAIRQDQPCFGCGRPGHHIRQCEEIDKLIQKGKVVRNQGNGMLQWPDGSRIFRSQNETMVQAITRNVVEAHFSEIMTYEPSLDTACDYIGVDRDSSDASSDEQADSGWTSGKVTHCQAYGAIRREPLSKTERKNVQLVSPSRSQGVKKFPRSREAQRLGRPEVSINKDVNQDSNKTRNPRRIAPTEVNQNIVKGKSNDKSVPMEVDQEVTGNPGHDLRKDLAKKKKSSIAIVPNPGPDRAKISSEIAEEILKGSVTLSIQDLVQNSPSVRRGLVNAMKQHREVSSQVQEKTGFAGEVVEDDEWEPSDQELSDQDYESDEEESDWSDSEVPVPQSLQPSGGLIKVPVEVGLAKMTGVFDSGSQLNIISQELAERTGIPWLCEDKHRLHLISVDGKVTRCAGMIPRAKMIVTTDNGPVTTRGNLYVKPQAGFQLLLGRKWGRKHRAHLIEDDNGSRVEFQTKRGWHNITPLPINHGVRDNKEIQQNSSRRRKAKVFAVRSSEEMQDEEVPETDQEEEEGSDRAQIGTEALNERENDFEYPPISIERLDPPTPAQRRQEDEIEDDDGMMDASEDQREAEGSHVRENEQELDWDFNRPEEESVISSELHETYIRMVQEGVTNEEWNEFREAEKQNEEYDEQRWREMCRTRSKSPLATEDAEPVQYETGDATEYQEPEPSQTLNTNSPGPIRIPSTSVPEARRQKKNLRQEGQTEMTTARRTRRTRKLTARAKGEEYQNFLKKYQRQEQQSRRTTRLRKTRPYEEAFSCGINEVYGNWADDEEDDDEESDEGDEEREDESVEVKGEGCGSVPSVHDVSESSADQYSQGDLGGADEPTIRPADPAQEGKETDGSDERKGMIIGENGCGRSVLDHGNGWSTKESQPTNSRSQELGIRTPRTDPGQRVKSQDVAEWPQLRKAVESKDHEGHLARSKNVGGDNLLDVGGSMGTATDKPEARSNRSGVRVANKGQEEEDDPRRGKNEVECGSKKRDQRQVDELEVRGETSSQTTEHKQEILSSGMSGEKGAPSVDETQESDPRWVRSPERETGVKTIPILEYGRDVSASIKSENGSSRLPHDDGEKDYDIQESRPIRNTPLPKLEEWTDISDRWNDPEWRQRFPKGETKVESAPVKIAPRAAVFEDETDCVMIPLSNAERRSQYARGSGEKMERSGEQEGKTLAPKLTDEGPDDQTLMDQVAGSARISAEQQSTDKAENEEREEVLQDETSRVSMEYIPPPDFEPKGVLTSKKIYIFAVDKDQRQTHLVARNVTFTLDDPTGDPQIYHGDATIRLDEPQVGTVIYVPKRERVRKAHKYIFKKHVHLNCEATVLEGQPDDPTETPGGTELAWKRLPREELEAVIDDLNKHPIKEGRQAKMFTVRKLKDGRIKVERGLKYNDYKAGTRDDDDKGESSEDTDALDEQVVRHLRYMSRYGYAPHTSDQALEARLRLKNLRHYRKCGKCGASVGKGLGSWEQNQRLIAKAESSLDEEGPSIKDEETHSEELADLPLDLLNLAKTEPTTYGECCCGRQGCPTLRDRISQQQSSLSTEVSQKPRDRMVDVPVPARGALEEDILGVDLPPLENRSPGILTTAHFSTLTDHTTHRDEECFYAFGATIVGGGKGQTPFAHQGQAYIRFYKTECSSHEESPPPPVPPRVWDARSRVFYDRNDPTTPFYYQAGIPREVSFEDQPTNWMSGARVPSQTRPEVVITDEKDRSLTMEHAIDKLRGLKNEVEPNRGVSKEEDPMMSDYDDLSCKSLSARSRQDETEEDLASDNDITKPMVWGASTNLERKRRDQQRRESYKQFLDRRAAMKDTAERSDGEKSMELETDDDESCEPNSRVPTPEPNKNLASDENSPFPCFRSSVTPAPLPRNPYPTPAPEANLGRQDEGYELVTNQDQTQVLEFAKKALTERRPQTPLLDPLNLGPDSPKMLYYQDDIEEEEEFEEEEDWMSSESCEKGGPPPYDQAKDQDEPEETEGKKITPEDAVILRDLQIGLKDLVPLFDRVLKRGDSREMRQCLTRLGLTQVATDLMNERWRGRQPKLEEWQPKIQSILLERRDEVEQCLKEMGGDEKEGMKEKATEGTKAKVKEEEKEVEKLTYSPVDWFPDVQAPTYVPENALDNDQEDHYVPESPDPENEDSDYRPASPVSDGLGEVRARIATLEERVDATSDDLKVKLKELESQVFADGCLLAELRWKANEMKKIRPRERADKRRRNRKDNNPRTNHRYHTRSVAAATDEGSANTRRELSRLDEEIKAVDEKRKSMLAEIKTIKAKLEKVLALAPDIERIAKMMDDQRKSQEEVNRALATELAALKFSFAPKIGERVADNGYQIGLLNARFQYLNQIVTGILTAWYSYSSNQACATETNNPLNVTNPKVAPAI